MVSEDSKKILKMNSSQKCVAVKLFLKGPNSPTEEIVGGAINSKLYVVLLLNTLFIYIFRSQNTYVVRAL